ncbi:hypothetical protein K2173_016890 [Erythroxylum novogranatense]|uniref:Alkyl transferase n=1 Tax=Erythroxylum novogranatense TaxID=1862640 RepID=A0AAV8U8E0_9ROSI|nr:hypothetical protein K2173_016890 [Erythroxylum novogranatense]
MFRNVHFWYRSLNASQEFPRVALRRFNDRAASLFPSLGLSTTPQHEQQKQRSGDQGGSENTGSGSSAADHLVSKEIILPAGLQRELMPNHVGVILDGNRRWARSKGLSLESGYGAGARRWKLMWDLCLKWDIKVLSGFCFSSENWGRPKEEVEIVLSVLERTVKQELETFMRKNIRLSVIGDVSGFPRSLREGIFQAEETTKNNDSLHLVMATNYSGQNDIVQACQRIAAKVKDGLLDHNHITRSLFEQELGTQCAEFPCPDLIIRTSDEQRISNFFLWQAAYAELYFAPELLPDFGEAEFVEALVSFQKRQRRFGSC